MSQFINAKENVVTQAIDGLLRSADGKLARLDGYPHIKVVVRTDWDKSKVALVSGGGSGHEPSHAGFVGRGMLSAAVCGEVFASPSVDAVLAGILAVTGKTGCLLIVKNYTGDRLNFGLAAERARAFGLKVSMVIVDDDIALPDIAQPRGVAGTLFVHKIAGALAEDGASLSEVTNGAQKIVNTVKSISMCLDTCTVPGSPKEERIGEGKAELGLGIHGEAGVEQVDFKNARQAISMLVERLGANMANQKHVALINNLGATTALEMSILCEEYALSKIAAKTSHIIGPATLMTSLDMRGFSISILPVDETQIEALNAGVELRDWPGMRPLGAIEVKPLPDGLSPIKIISSKHEAHQTFLENCCDVMIKAEGILNTLDAKSGDGDTGSTLAGAARALKGSIERLPLADMTQLFRAIGGELSQTMGGSSGVILAIFFAAAGDACANGNDIVASLKAGLERVKQVGGAKIGDRTMIDALEPALDAMAGGINPAAIAARKGADHTALITKAKAGRATYISAENLRGHNDPGAEAVALLFEHINR